MRKHLFFFTCLMGFTRLCVLVISFVLASCSFAKEPMIDLPGDDKQRLSISNLNFSGYKFFNAYMSKDLAQRRFAEMYLVGVLDSSEGLRWCSYANVLPGSVQELVYLGFKNRENSDLLSGRASQIIISILEEQLPCKEQQ